MWRRREIENYLCQHSTLLAFAEAQGREQSGPLFAEQWRTAMEEAINKISAALRDLERPEPCSPDIKASDEFLDPLFKLFYKKLGLPNLTQKTDYYTLAPFVPPEELDGEIKEKLDAIMDVAEKASPVGQEEQ
jgi:hypothetical protein